MESTTHFLSTKTAFCIFCQKSNFSQRRHLFCFFGAAGRTTTESKTHFCQQKPFQRKHTLLSNIHFSNILAPQAAPRRSRKHTFCKQDYFLSFLEKTYMFRSPRFGQMMLLFDQFFDDWGRRASSRAQNRSEGNAFSRRCRF